MANFVVLRFHHAASAGTAGTAELKLKLKLTAHAHPGASVDYCVFLLTQSDVVCILGNPFN